jgi:hypothetical protein
MPLVEAAYLGPLPIAAFRRALFISGVDGRFHELEKPEFSHSRYDILLNGWRDDCKNTGDAPLVGTPAATSSKPLAASARPSRISAKP